MRNFFFFAFFWALYLFRLWSNAKVTLFFVCRGRKNQPRWTAQRLPEPRPAVWGGSDFADDQRGRHELWRFHRLWRILLLSARQPILNHPLPVYSSLFPMFVILFLLFRKKIYVVVAFSSSLVPLQSSLLHFVTAKFQIKFLSLLCPFHGAVFKQFRKHFSHEMFFYKIKK